MPPTLRPRTQKTAARRTTTQERRRRSTIPSTALKRAAAESFQGYDPDATECPTESESESERLQRYPAKRKPSPRATASHMRQQLKEAGARASGRKALKAEMEEESGRWLTSRSHRRIIQHKAAEKLERMPRVLPDANGVEDEDAKPGSGQVFLDGARPKREVTLVRRTLVKKNTEGTNAPTDPKSDMGLFGSLPGELRNRIYRLALVEGHGQPFAVEMLKETCNIGPCIHMSAGKGLPGILSSCKQIRAEAMPIFIAENDFKFDAELVKARCVPNWLRSIGDYGKLLNKVVLDIVCWEVPMNRRFTSTEKVGVHYEMTLQWQLWAVNGKIQGYQWSLKVDKVIAAKAASEYSTLNTYIDTLNKDLRYHGKSKEMALREFVWSDWLAKLVYICKK